MAYPIFSLSEFFLPQCQTLLGGFSYCSLPDSFPSFSILPSTLAFLQFSLSSLLFNFLCIEEYTQGWGERIDHCQHPGKGLFHGLWTGRGPSSYSNVFSPSTWFLIQVCSHCSIPGWCYFQREFCDPNSILTLALNFFSKSSTQVFFNCKQDMLHTPLRGILGRRHQQFKVWHHFERGWLKDTTVETKAFPSINAREKLSK